MVRAEDRSVSLRPKVPMDSGRELFGERFYIYSKDKAHINSKQEVCAEDRNVS